MKVIATVDQFGGVSRNNRVPWSYPEIDTLISSMTEHSTCIMGPNTYQHFILKSLIEDSDFLTTRKIVVVSRRKCRFSDVDWLPDLKFAKQLYDDNSFVIGSLKLVEENLDGIDEVFMNVIRRSYACDEFFPVIDMNRFHAKTEATLVASDGIEIDVLRYSKTEITP